MNINGTTRVVSLDSVIQKVDVLSNQIGQFYNTVDVRRRLPFSPDGTHFYGRSVSNRTVLISSVGTNPSSISYEHWLINLNLL